mmetsp:Transcript_20626/g.33265  ORF Transcript_20626/g.33265 Transcript_20626/m.33265 type:complete len:226 (+) Transcript_20626:36-713(+)
MLSLRCSSISQRLLFLLLATSVGSVVGSRVLLSIWWSCARWCTHIRKLLCSLLDLRARSCILVCCQGICGFQNSISFLQVGRGVCKLWHIFGSIVNCGCFFKFLLCCHVDCLNLRFLLNHLLRSLCSILHLKLFTQSLQLSFLLGVGFSFCFIFALSLLLLFLLLLCLLCLFLLFLLHSLSFLCFLGIQFFLVHGPLPSKELRPKFITRLFSLEINTILISASSH